MLDFPRWKVIFVVSICLLGFAFAGPNFLDRQTADKTPTWLPHKQVNLGLDLQGGSHLLLEVDFSSVTKEYLDGLVDSMRSILRKNRIRYQALGSDGTQARVTIRDANMVKKATDLLKTVDRSTEINVKENRIFVNMSDKSIIERRNAAVQQSIEIVRRRIDETGVREPTIQRQGEDRIILQLPGIDNPERVKRLIGKTAKMSFQLVDLRNSVNEAMSGRLPVGSRLLPHVTDISSDGQPRKVLVRKRVMVSGENLVDAQPSFDQQTNEPVVSFRFDSVGGKRFAKATTENVGKPFAIVLDGKVLSAPVIREPIIGGSGQISGSFTTEAANDLALLLRAGALPAPLHILEERTVGPGLGADSIAAGKFASIIGLIAVVVFMGLAYGLFGIYANIALFVNMVLILAVLSFLQATLTLPGIAGIILTIGMAVDANVLIFERIREETRIGRTPMNAIDAGYKRALTTIIDANLTTLIAAILLYVFGSGPIRGFAVTLAVGIVTSMFTAIMLTRLLVVKWFFWAKPTKLSE